MQNVTSNFGILQRYKKEIPFSTLLNEYINQKFRSMCERAKVQVYFVPIDKYFELAEQDTKKAFEYMQNDFKKGHLMIWTGASENTIFGLPEINHRFRAIHDIFHCLNGLGFDTRDELLVNYIQQREFHFDGLPSFECQLLNIETAGQILYYEINGKFPEDQRAFCIGELYKFYNYEAPKRNPEYKKEVETKFNL